MKTNIPGKKKAILEVRSNTDREYYFYCQHLRKLDLFNNEDYENLDELRSKQDQLDYLNNLISVFSSPNQLIEEMTHEFQKEQVNIGDIRPFNKESEQFYNFVWSIIKHNSREIDAQFNFKAIDIDRANSEQRYKDIISFLHNSEATYQEQLSLFEEFSEVWNKKAFPQKKLINWLSDENEKQWRWAFEYIKNNKPFGFQIAWQPSSDSEKRNVIIATIDIWKNLSDKELFLDKMKRAWSQKKFRDKPNGKKPYSFSMTEKTKQRLDALAELKEQNLNEVIEELIREEYNIHDW
ncbi:MAG: hypothetical protein ACI935_000650 [Moritella dasanensis]|jgi:hypothetical protein